MKGERETGDEKRDSRQAHTTSTLNQMLTRFRRNCGGEECHSAGSPCVASLFFFDDGGDIKPRCCSSSYDNSAVSIVVSTLRFPSLPFLRLDAGVRCCCGLLDTPVGVGGGGGPANCC